MKLYIINGPNINMLGIREPEKYGTKSYSELISEISQHLDSVGVTGVFYQSNHEGDLVDKIQEAYFEGADGIIINPAAYTHTGIAILDALLAVGIPAVEVHLTDPFEREDFRKVSYAGRACIKTVKGKGFSGYIEAIDYLIGVLNENKN